MSDSRNTVVVASATEREVKGYLSLIGEGGRRAFNSRRNLNTDQEGRMEKAKMRTLVVRLSYAYCTGGEVSCTLLHIGGDDRRVDTVLGKGGGGLLVRRAIRTDLLESRVVISPIANISAVTIPSSHLGHARVVICRHLPSRDQLNFDSVDLHLVKQTSEVLILGDLTQDRGHLQNRSTGKCTRSNLDGNFSPILQAETRQVALLRHHGKVHHRRTTSTTEAGTPVPSVGTTSRATVTTVCHFWEWYGPHVCDVQSNSLRMNWVVRGPRCW